MYQRFKDRRNLYFFYRWVNANYLFIFLFFSIISNKLESCGAKYELPMALISFPIFFSLAI